MVVAEEYVLRLNEKQQRAIRDLFEWREESLQSDIVLGGPVDERYICPWN